MEVQERVPQVVNTPGRNVWFTKFRDLMLSHVEYDEDEEDESVPEPVLRASAVSPKLTLQHEPEPPAPAPVSQDALDTTRVSVRFAVKTLDDARRLVNGLKAGHAQILNCAQVPATVLTQITDFLFGATYALDGTVERIGEDLYLFTPAGVTVDAADPAVTSRS